MPLCCVDYLPRLLSGDPHHQRILCLVARPRFKLWTKATRSPDQGDSQGDHGRDDAVVGVRVRHMPSTSHLSDEGVHRKRSGDSESSVSPGNRTEAFA
jgi:hypothetical protein